jgi:hypothetical protein
MMNNLGLAWNAGPKLVMSNLEMSILSLRSNWSGRDLFYNYLHKPEICLLETSFPVQGVSRQLPKKREIGGVGPDRVPAICQRVEESKDLDISSLIRNNSDRGP